MTCILAYKTKRWIQILLAESPPKNMIEFNDMPIDSIELSWIGQGETLMNEWSESWALVDPFGKHSGSLFIAQDVN